MISDGFEKKGRSLTASFQTRIKLETRLKANCNELTNQSAIAYQPNALQTNAYRTEACQPSVCQPIYGPAQLAY